MTLNDHKERLSKILGLLVNPAGLEAWAQKHHLDAKGLLKHVLRRPPLVVLAGVAQLFATPLQRRRRIVGDPTRTVML